MLIHEASANQVKCFISVFAFEHFNYLDSIMFEAIYSIKNTYITLNSMFIYSN
ncbi:MAG: hypothetical protein MAG581_01216 [Deltaproteobacteria bacterium]|nr:hypothetical protein [Deltaproteobacteria bacterium]